MKAVHVGVDIGGSHIQFGFLGKNSRYDGEDIDLLSPLLSVDIDGSTVTQIDLVKILRDHILAAKRANPSWRLVSIGELCSDIARYCSTQTSNPI